ncbi:MAG: DUF72 domain-containing protein [Chthoniobacterales bacterium]|nr:DUF72 domain-containing protein [Chthoniobacterales bacterium]
MTNTDYAAPARTVDSTRLTTAPAACGVPTHHTLNASRGTRRWDPRLWAIAHLLNLRMGCFLFQLPPSCHYTPARLHRILSQLDPARRNVVEFRGHS